MQGSERLLQLPQTHAEASQDSSSGADSDGRLLLQQRLQRKPQRQPMQPRGSEGVHRIELLERMPLSVEVPKNLLRQQFQDDLQQEELATSEIRSHL